MIITYVCVKGFPSLITKNTRFSNQSTQRGFTLIELVVVIVIIGILAVTAAPKFIDLKGEATAATLTAVTGSLSSGIKFIQSKAMIQGKYDVKVSTTLTFDGLTFTTYNQGVPREIWNDGFKQLIDGDFNHLGSGTGQMGTVCSGNEFCVIDVLPASNVISGKGGWGIFIIPNGYKLADKNCFAYYSFEISGGLLIYKETDTVVDGC